jgi:hypothetical protein
MSVEDYATADVEINPARFLENKTPMNFTKNIGMLLLAIYLILVGLMSFVAIPIPAIVLGILAILAGVMILLGK